MSLRFVHSKHHANRISRQIPGQSNLTIRIPSEPSSALEIRLELVILS